MHPRLQHMFNKIFDVFLPKATKLDPEEADNIWCTIGIDGIPLWHSHVVSISCSTCVLHLSHLASHHCFVHACLPHRRCSQDLKMMSPIHGVFEQGRNPDLVVQSPT